MHVQLDPPAGVSDETLSRFNRLAEKAAAGDGAAREAVARLLEDEPAIYRSFGDLAASSRLVWLELASGGSAAYAECLKRHYSDLEEDLAGPGSPRLVRVLAARVATCAAMAAVADTLAAAITAGDGALRREALERQRAANAMLLAAARSLAAAQKLLRRTPSPLDMLEPRPERAAGRPARKSGGRLRHRPVAGPVTAN